MRLEEAKGGVVVRNRRNSSYYRVVRPESHRIRIRPLEVFPNGLLIEKTADTIVDADLEVDPVAEWDECLYVEVDPQVAEQMRATKTVELEQKRDELRSLEEQMATIPAKDRGSHAVKVKTFRWRVHALERGFEDPTADISNTTRVDSAAVISFATQEIVQLPSGNPALVTSLSGTMATVRTKVAGTLMTIPIQAQVLRPWEQRHLATV